MIEIVKNYNIIWILALVTMLMSNGYCYEMNNSDYDIFGAITSGNDNLSNTDYDVGINIGLPLADKISNTEYDVALGFFYGTIVEPYPVTGEEIFDDNVYADEYETANVTLSLSSIYHGSHTFNYNIPYYVGDVNLSSIIVQNKTKGNISYTYANGVITVVADGNEDPYVISYDVKAVKKMNISEYGSCPTGYTNNTNYCRRVLASSVKDVYDYRYYINVTRNDTNSSHILHNQSTNIFTRFNDRVDFTITLNGSVVNTTNTIANNVLQFNVSDSYDGTYSLCEGIYYIHVNYYVIPTSLPPSGGTAGGSGDDDVPDSLLEIMSGMDNITAYDFTVPEFINYSIVIGTFTEKQILIRNLNDTTLTIMAKTICPKNESMCDWNWFNVSNKKSSNKLIELEPFESKNITLYSLPYAESGTHNMLIEFKKTDTYNNRYTIVSQTIEIPNIIQNTIQFLGHKIWSTPTIPYTKKSGMTIGDLIIISFGLSLITILGIKFSKKKHIKQKETIPI